MAHIINSNITYVDGTGATPSGWYPPTYWPDGWGDEITDSDDGFVALAAVYPNAINYFGFYLYYTGGGGTIEYGDGATAALSASGALNEHIFDYTNVPGTVTEKGYKIATMKILITGTCTGVNYARAHTTIGTVYNYSTPILAIKQRSQNATQTYFHNNPHIAGKLQYLDLGTDAAVNPYAAFRGHSSLMKIIWKPITTAWTGLLSWSSSIQGSENTRLDAFNLDDVHWDVCTSMDRCFSYTNGSQGVFHQSIDNVTTLSQAFRSTTAFQEVILENTSNVTTIATAIYQSTVTYFSMDDASSVITTTNFVRPTNAYGQLTGLILSGLSVGINLSYQIMTATDIDAFFTSLGTASGAQTITVTGNPGAATCNTAIATGKGFTVVT